MKYAHVRIPDLAKRNKKRVLPTYKNIEILANLGTVSEMMEKTADQYPQGIKD